MAKKKTDSAVIDAPVVDRVPEELTTDLTLRDNQLQIGKFFKFSNTGLTISGRPSFDLCSVMNEMLRVLHDSMQFAIGDFINWAEGTFGEEASQLIDASMWSESTVTVYRWVAAKIDPRNRRMNLGLSFSHHQEVADLQPSEQVLWLERAEKGDDDGKVWTVKRLRREIDASKKGQAAASAANPDVYQVIVICESKADLDTCVRQLESLGRTNIKTKSSDD
jgi:hypothetical protein